MNQPVVWFEVVGKDVKRLHEFYGGLFGWQFEMAKTGGLFSRQKVFEVGGTKFVKSPGASLQNEEVVLVSVSKLNQLWKETGGTFYIPKGGGGAEIGGRREGFNRFREQHPNTPIQMSRVFVSKDGTLGFVDGRHRFSVFRDDGKRVIAVTTERGASARRLKKLAGVKQKAKSK